MCICSYIILYIYIYIYIYIIIYIIRYMKFCCFQYCVIHCLTLMILSVLPVLVTGVVGDESAISTGEDRMLQQ